MRRPGGVRGAHLQRRDLRAEPGAFEHDAAIEREPDGLLGAEHEVVSLVGLVLRARRRAPADDQAGREDQRE